MLAAVCRPSTEATEERESVRADRLWPGTWRDENVKQQDMLKGGSIPAVIIAKFEIDFVASQSMLLLGVSLVVKRFHFKVEFNFR